MKRINKESLMNLRERANCKRISDSILSTMETLHFHINRQHHREYSSTNSHISTISSLKLDSAVSKRNPQSENYGLYALKCDRSRASQRGIILHIPTKSGAGGSGKKTPDPKEMIHEKFEPCRRSIESVDVQESEEIVQKDDDGCAGKMELTKAVVAPPRRKRHVKCTKKERLSHQQKTCSVSIDTERKRNVPLRAEMESSLQDIKSNLMENRLKMARGRSQKESIDIFKLNHSDAFDDFDSIFEVVSQDRDLQDSQVKPPLKMKNDTKVKLKENDISLSENNSPNGKIGEHLKTFPRTEGSSGPKIKVQQWQMSNHVPECKISKSITTERTSRIERIQFHNEFIPNSFSAEAPIKGNSLNSAPSNSIDYYIMKSSERKVTLPPAQEVESEANFKYFGDENNQIWTI